MMVMARSWSSQPSGISCSTVDNRSGDPSTAQTAFASRFIGNLIEAIIDSAGFAPSDMAHVVTAMLVGMALDPEAFFDLFRP
jgi:hypothetical protein